MLTSGQASSGVHGRAAEPFCTKSSQFSLSMEYTASGGGRNILTSGHQSVC